VLYRRDDLFTLVEELVGLGLRENRHVTSRLRRDSPIVMVSGSRGMGKTAVLKEIADAYGNRAPRVRLDIGSGRFSAHWPDAAPDSTPLLRLLRDLKWGLELRVGLDRYPLRFPRLALALLAITVSRPDVEITLDEARQQLTDAQQSVAAIAHDERDGWANDWLTDVVTEVSGGLSEAAPFPVSILVKASVRVFLAKTLTAPRRAAPLDWHRDYDPGAPGDGYEALITLGRDFRRGGDWLPGAEQALVAAFLADLDAAYRGIAHLSRAAFPLVLLDNAHLNPVGERFLRLALACRTAARPDHVVIVATEPGPLAARLAAAAGAIGPGNRLQRRVLTPLTQPDVLNMLANADQRRLPPDIASIVFRLTDGLPLGVQVIASALEAAAPAAARQAGTRPVDRSEILRLASPGPDADLACPVAERILRQLIPDHGWQSRLTALAAALSDAEARAVAGAYLDAGHADRIVPDAEDLLARNGWPRDAGPLVADSFLRVLLLHELGRRTGGTTSTAVHAALRDRCAQVNTGSLDKSEPCRLYHCLALGHAADVARRLSDAFAPSSADDWIEGVRLISRAPHDAGEDRRRAVAVGGSAEGGADEVSRSVSRLLHAAWLLADPLAATDPELEDKLAEELRLLSGKHPTGNGVLWQASRNPQAWVFGYRPPR
jgi:hypothetical protein